MAHKIRTSKIPFKPRAVAALDALEYRCINCGLKLLPDAPSGSLREVCRDPSGKMPSLGAPVKGVAFERCALCFAVAEVSIDARERSVKQGIAEQRLAMVAKSQRGITTAAFAFRLILGALGVAMVLGGIFSRPYDSTDEQEPEGSKRERSGMRLYRDALTGCEYLARPGLGGNLTPRLDAKGQPMCAGGLNDRSGGQRGVYDGR